MATAMRTAVTLSSMAAAAQQQQQHDDALASATTPSGSDGSGSQPRGRELFSEEVRGYLESVYNVSSQPEEYVKYRLHLVTRLEMRQINDWFHNRRQRERKRSRNVADGDDGDGSAQAQRPVPAAGSPALPPPALLGGLPLLPTSIGGIINNPAASALPTAQRMPDHTPGQAMAQAAPAASGGSAGSPLLPASISSHARLMLPLPGQQVNIVHAANAGSGAASDFAQPAAAAGGPAAGGGRGRKRSGGEDKEEARFKLSDLAVVASLVGLETIACDDSVRQEGVAEPAAGLYLFEQLTRLDSLTLEAAPAAKRQRTRHQHFWRNSDKIPRNDRVYVQAKEVQAAQEGRGPPVIGRGELPPGERSNAWTVALTPSGVVDYLNRKTSPLGVRIFRALMAQLNDPTGGSLAPHNASAAAAALPRVSPVPDGGRGRSSPASLLAGPRALSAAVVTGGSSGGGPVAGTVGQNPGGQAPSSPQVSPAQATITLPGLPALTLPRPSPLHSAGIAAAIGASGAPPSSSANAAGWSRQPPGSLPNLSGIGGFLQSGGASAMLLSGLANPVTSSDAAATGMSAGAPGSAAGGFGSTGGSPTVSGGAAKGFADGSAPLAPSLLRDAVIQQAKKVAMPSSAASSDATAPPATSAAPEPVSAAPLSALSNSGSAPVADSPVEAYRRLISQQGFGMPALPLRRATGSGESAAKPSEPSPRSQTDGTPTPASAAAATNGTTVIGAAAGATRQESLPSSGFTLTRRSDSSAASLEASAAALLAGSRSSHNNDGRQEAAAAAVAAVPESPATSASGGGSPQPAAAATSAAGGWASTQPLLWQPSGSAPCTSQSAASILDLLPQHVGGTFRGTASPADLQAFIAAKIGRGPPQRIEVPLSGELTAIAAQHGFDSMQIRFHTPDAAGRGTSDTDALLAAAASAAAAASVQPTPAMQAAKRLLLPGGGATQGPDAEKAQEKESLPATAAMAPTVARPQQPSRRKQRPGERAADS